MTFTGPVRSAIPAPKRIEYSRRPAVRGLCLLFVFASLPLAGCSALVAGSGKELGTLTDRTKARQCFGVPLATGITDDGCEYDDFKTHRKFAESWKGMYSCMFFAWTCGLSELYAFP